MTAEEAVARAEAAFDEEAADLLQCAEQSLRNRGATAEELAIELGRLQAAVADAKPFALAHVRAFALSGRWSIH